jgi:hypothetical protein
MKGMKNMKGGRMNQSHVIMSSFMFFMPFMVKHPRVIFGARQR